MSGKTTVRTFACRPRWRAVALRLGRILRHRDMRSNEIGGMIASDAREGVRGPNGARYKKRQHQRANGGDGECRTKFPTHGAQL